MKYIIYKLINEVVFFLSKPRKIGPCLYSLGFDPIGPTKSCCGEFYFDLNHRTTHLGDRLFLIPLINSMIGGAIKIYTNDKILIEMVSELLQFGIEFKTQSPRASCINVLLKPSYLDKRGSKNRRLIVNFADSKCSDLITKELIKSVGLIADVSYRDLILEKKASGHDRKKIVIFSNYIDSGRFRRFFCNEGALVEKCLALKSSGYIIFHVGSSLDKSNDRSCYDFVDSDLRGKTSVVQLMALIRDAQDCVAVTYDNFVMHQSLLSGHNVFVLFRGRFSRRQFWHHINHVNPAFGTITGYLN